MKRLAFFVEGYSELLFIEKLIWKIADSKNVTIDRGSIKGGKTIPRLFEIFTATNVTSGDEYYVLIVNCQGDRQVKSRMIEEHKRFTDQGYEKIIGLRDVRPDFQHSDIPRLKTHMQQDFDPSLAPAEVILSTMEIESLFLGEATHFEKIDPAITASSINARLGFDPVSDDMELRPEPAVDLTNCYAIAGKTYNKYLVQDTINVLDFDHIHLVQPARFQSLARLVSNIDNFLFTAA